MTLIKKPTTGMKDILPEEMEIRQYVMPDETLEEAQARCAEIAQAKKDSRQLLLDEALDEEAQLG